ncbi:MAG: VanZ family protein [Chloroflexota bacterium]|nr:VanZ family protein [Chloroflexota bacterium]
MDRWLLHFINQTLAHPWLDIVMITLSKAGIPLLLMLALILILRGKRRTGEAILLAIGLGLCCTLTFYYLALRPRPVDVRLLLPTPIFPAFPSGHTVAAFSTATVLALARGQARWTPLLLLGAAWMGISRIYLGHHYPSDVLAGAVFGMAIGAACYGAWVVEPSWRRRVRWLLWPQAALIVVVTQMAYLNLFPHDWLRWPLADKVLHLILFGAVVFWLNLWLAGRQVKIGRWLLPLALVLPLLIAATEEGLQSFSPLRTFDLLDLAADLLGMLLFWRLSVLFMRTDRAPLL